MSTGSRWFPGQESEQTFEVPGWVLAGGERWEDATDGGADLTSLRVHAPRTLALQLRLERAWATTLEFAGLAELQIEGDLEWEGEAELGWEILGTSMLVAARPREDGLLVYVLELPQAVLCFASAAGVVRRPDQ